MQINMPSKAATVTSVDGINAQGSQSLESQKRRAKLKTIVSKRMLDARLLNGYSQAHAATLFGYKSGNSTQLSLCERGQRMPPLSVLLRACEVYRCSMDYLVGLSADPDRDPQAEVRRFIVDSASQMMQAQTTALLEGMLGQLKKEGPLVAACQSVANEGQVLVDALRRFIKLNAATFNDDMRGSAFVLTALESFEANGLGHALRQLQRFERVNAESSRRIKAMTADRATHAANMDMFQTAD